MADSKKLLKKPIVQEEAKNQPPLNPKRNSRSPKTRKSQKDVDAQMNRYEEEISKLTKEVESLRNELSIKANTKILLNQGNEPGNQPSKYDKISKRISAHFQEEIRMKNEIFDCDKVIDGYTNNLKDKEFQLFKCLNTNPKKNGSGSLLKEKELKTQIAKITEQINMQKSILFNKESKYNEHVKKREEFESIINKLGKDKVGQSLQYLYQGYIFEINNLTNEHIRRQNLNSLRQKDLKIAKLIEQIKIRDEYINSEKKELSKKNIKFVFEGESQIKNLEDMNIDKSFSLPVVIKQEQTQMRIPSPTKRVATSADLSQQRPQYNNPNSKYDYSAYSNPNIVKEKAKFKTKTNAIMNQIQKNELSELKLNIINGMHKNSGVVYVNKKDGKEYEDNPDNSNNIVIEFDGKALNKSQSNTSFQSNGPQGNSNNFQKIRKEREIDSIIKKLMLGKGRGSPYMKNY